MQQQQQVSSHPLVVDCTPAAVPPAMGAHQQFETEFAEKAVAAVEAQHRLGAAVDMTLADVDVEESVLDTEAVENRVAAAHTVAAVAIEVLLVAPSRDRRSDMVVHHPPDTLQWEAEQSGGTSAVVVHLQFGEFEVAAGYCHIALVAALVETLMGVAVVVDKPERVGMVVAGKTPEVVVGMEANYCHHYHLAVAGHMSSVVAHTEVAGAASPSAAGNIAGVAVAVAVVADTPSVVGVAASMKQFAAGGYKQLETKGQQQQQSAAVAETGECPVVAPEIAFLVVVVVS
jgi:hypothetical protein